MKRETTSGISSETRIWLEEGGIRRVEILQSYLTPPKLTGLQIFKGLHSHYRRLICKLTHISKPLHRLDEKGKPFQESTAWFNICQNWKGSLWLFQLTHVSESFWCWTLLLELASWHRTQMMLLACYRRDLNSPWRNYLHYLIFTAVIKPTELFHQ